jgi:hypothetical protein
MAEILFLDEDPIVIAEINTLLVSFNTTGIARYYNAANYISMSPQIGPSADYYGFWSIEHWEGVIYVSDVLSDKIWKFNFESRALIGSFDIVSLSSTSANMKIYNGVIYLLQVSSGNVYKYDLNGNLLGFFNGGPAWVTWNLAVANDAVYVNWSETWLNEGRISKYSLEGVSQGTINFTGLAEGLFVDTELIIGNTFLGIQKVQRYTLGGSLILESAYNSQYGFIKTILAMGNTIYVCRTGTSSCVTVFRRDTLTGSTYFADGVGGACGICYVAA